MNSSIEVLVHKAVNRRMSDRGWRSPDTETERLIHSDGDGVPGITVDRLGSLLLVESHRKDAPAEAVILSLRFLFGDAMPIFCKQRWAPDRKGRSGFQVSGEKSPEVLFVKEDGLHYQIKLCDDEHIGLFLDGRPARQKVRQLAAGKRVLNLFSYTGGFGVAAAAGRARSTVNVDNKRSARDIGEINYLENRLPVDSRTFLKSDVLEFLGRAARGRGRYDLIILDPPPRFRRKKRRDFDAALDFGRLLGRCVPVAAPGALILAGTNALRVDDELWKRHLEEASVCADRPLTLLEAIGPGPDFPAGADRPVARFALLQCDGGGRPY